LRYPYQVSSRSPFAPSAGTPTRFPSGWRARLGRDPIPILLREGSPALVARVRRDLIDDDEAPGLDEIAGYPEAKTLLRKQEKDGSFVPKTVEKALGSQKFARALATLRSLERMTDVGLGLPHAAVKSAAEVLLDSQAADGGLSDLTLSDTREGRGKMVALHFHGWALGALCRAGLDTDERISRGFQFLLDKRQADGGWAWRGVRTDSAARPSSHLVTGMALRAFAASASRRTSREARRAAELLATRFLQPDRYPDRKAASYWEVLGEPRFYTDVLDALDCATAVGLGKENSGVRTAEAYLRGRQLPDGLWYPGPPVRAEIGQKAPPPSDKDREAARWLTVRVLLVLRRVN
jgi:Squalene-hopene cyclase C-terminal domain/Prenyltransferase and squalene oxidase repeat